MKAQISRDSFNEEKQYSAVYQQQGRMITDADWNEMVRILKHRMDRTVGASIASGSPREGGILTEEIANKKWTLSDKKFVAVEKLRWGRVYVDGMYGEIRPLDQEDLNKLGLSEEEQIKITDEPSIMAFLAFQRDYHRLRMITPNRPYVAYIDLWERLVIGLEDKKLNDSALHGADTCVRTQTMSQVKLAEIDQESFEKGAEDWKPPAECGNAMLGVEKITADPATSNVCDRETQKIKEYRQRNTLFRLEVHTAYEKGGKHKVILKWSSENGAEQHKNDPDLPNFWDYDHIYECYSDLSEKLMGVQTTSPGGGPGILEKAELYTYRNYKEKRNNVDSAARKMTYVRRWDGYLTLERMANSKSWDLAEEESHPNATIDFETITSGEDAQKLIINDVIEGHKLKFVIARWIKEEGEPRKKQSCLFVSGDYWLVLVRDQGSEVNAEVLSHEPVGIHHQYLVLGVFKLSIKGPSHLRLTSQQWRRLSFPSLTNLTLDRVLVEDENGNESSVTDEINKCVKKAGDTMTGSLKFLDASNREVMVLSSAPVPDGKAGSTPPSTDAGTSDNGEPRILFEPPGSGPEAAWIRASTRQIAGTTGRPPGGLPPSSGGPGTGRPGSSPSTDPAGTGRSGSPPSTDSIPTSRRTTLELRVSDDGLDDILLNASHDVLLNADHNVGVGTKAPHAKLDVRGPVRINSDEPDASTQQANELEIQANHAEAGHGFLEVPWVYTANVQGASGGLGGEDYARISLGSRDLDQDWDADTWVNEHQNDEVPQIGFGFGNRLDAVLTGRYDVRLMSVSTTDALEDEGRHLVIVALVGTGDRLLHIRIFNSSGVKVVDLNEYGLDPEETRMALKERLTPFPDESTLTQQDKTEIISIVASLDVPDLSRELPTGDLSLRGSLRAPAVSSPGNLRVHARGDMHVTAETDMHVAAETDMHVAAETITLSPPNKFTGHGINHSGAEIVAKAGEVKLRSFYRYTQGYTCSELTLTSGGCVTLGKLDNPTNLKINGDLECLGNKGGYTVDLFVNEAGEQLEQGDVIVLGKVAYYSGLDDNIPVPEVDLSSTEYDTRVCGVVAELKVELDETMEDDDSESPTGEKPSPKSTRPKNERLQVFSASELAHVDRKKIRTGQLGKMVTVGCFAHCKVDADAGAIAIGDLLTTSKTKGHAQKVLDPSKAIGAIIGKAMGHIENGRGTIPILVNLQ